MKSSSGNYFIGLDHVRAVAIFMVFTWHYIHINIGHQSLPAIFPLSILTQGHTGVALFMTLSGYLFAKLLDGKDIIYTSFIWNRFLRIIPLLCVVLILVGVGKYFSGESLLDFARTVAAGVIKPSLPNGGWSITVEFHFYLILPALLFLTKKWKHTPLLILMAAVIMRTILYRELGQIQTLSYWTIIGRIDQFLLGILAYQFKRDIAGKHFLILGALFMFTIFYWRFDSQGGFFMHPSYPSPDAIWVYMPTVEGAAYALAIAWYDNSFRHSTGKMSRLIAAIGTYSYSIYSWHILVMFILSGAIHGQIIDLSRTYMAISFYVFCLLLMIPIGYLSYTFIESPFLKFRTRYTVKDKT